MQGALKNAANNGIALWSFMIALHVFNLLFLRWHTTLAGMTATLIGGWSAVAMIVLLGPSVFEKPDRPYFGVSGYWCWITDDYPTEQTYMEYFFVGLPHDYLLFVLKFSSGIYVCWSWLPTLLASPTSCPGQPHASRRKVALTLDSILRCMAIILRTRLHRLGNA